MIQKNTAHVGNVNRSGKNGRAAFTMQGIQVGPTLFNTDPDLLYGIFFGFFISFILGPIIEKNFRRALTLSAGSFSIFGQSAISKVILVILLAVVFYSIWAVSIGTASWEPWPRSATRGI